MSTGRNFTTEKSEADLRNRFSYHSPDDEKVDVHSGVRRTFHYVAMVIDKLLPPSREKSLCITALEEAMMWGNAAVARHDQNGNRLEQEG